MPTEDYERFRRSLTIGYIEWHDGIGYDLEALAALSPDELGEIEDLFVKRRGVDWRDLEVLDRIGSPRALARLHATLRDKSVDNRIEAARRLASRGLLAESEIETIVIEALSTTTLLDGMVKTLAFAEQFPTPAVKQKLLRCSIRGNNDLRVHAAALVHFLYGKSSSPFDWAFRPLYLRFGSKDRQERRAAYEELCANIGLAPED